MAPTALHFLPIPGVPLVQAGDDLAGLVIKALRGANGIPATGDVVAVAQKIVSKAEGRSVRLDSVTPSPEARDIAARANKDPRVVELILKESRAILRVSPGVIISEHHTGIVLANAGIDRSNLEGSDECALLLPADPDGSAARLRDRLQQEFGVPLGVLVTDSIGRAWRLGTLGTAIGCAGLLALNDLRGRRDLFGRQLLVSEVAVADSLAATAVLAMGEAAEGTPLVLVRGAGAGSDQGQTARTAVRPVDEDLFR
jgi:coenzyme F420-0:L-glutamate ligase / coenzyme F420-1:gamma-L-glutamate ligase